MATEPHQRLAEPDPGIIVFGIENERLLEGLPGPGVLLPGEPGVAEADVELDGVGVELESFLQGCECCFVVTAVILLVRTFIILLRAEERCEHKRRLQVQWVWTDRDVGRTATAVVSM